jgi:hypothetical protein
MTSRMVCIAILARSPAGACVEHPIKAETCNEVEKGRCCHSVEPSVFLRVLHVSNTRGALHRTFWRDCVASCSA